MSKAPRFLVHEIPGTTFTRYYVIDTYSRSNLGESPLTIKLWTTAKEPNAKFLAEDFCKRHNK